MGPKKIGVEKYRLQVEYPVVVKDSSLSGESIVNTIVQDVPEPPAVTPLSL